MKDKYSQRQSLVSKFTYINRFVTLKETYSSYSSVKQTYALNLPTTSILTTPQFADYLHIDNGRAFSDFCPLILSCVSTVTLTTKPFYSVKLRISEEVFAFRSNTKLIPGYALNQSPCIPSEEPVG